MIFQDPLTALNPVQTVGRQVAEMARIHEDVIQAGGLGPRRRDAQARRHPAAGEAGPDAPARVLRRHAPAGDDRDGDHVQPRPADRRRADDRARRHRAGAGARGPDGDQGRDRLGDPADHPRPRRRRRARRPGHGDVRRPRGRGRHGPRGVLRDPAPVHARPARVAASTRRRRQRAAQADPRQPAVARQRAVGLRVPPALRLRPRGALPHRGAGAAQHRRDDAQVGMPLRRGAPRHRGAGAARGGGRTHDARPGQRSRGGARAGSRRAAPGPQPGQALLGPRRRLRRRGGQGAGRLGRVVRRLSRGDARSRRRVGLRQVDDRPADPPPDRARRRAASRSTARDVVEPARRRADRVPPERPDRVPGPVRVAQPAQEGRRRRSARRCACIAG